MIRCLSLALALVLALTAPVSGQTDADRAAIHDLLHRYAQLEDAGDIETQARLMTQDRVYIGVFNIGRRLDQTQNTAIQQATMDLNRELYPGMRIFTEVKAPHVHFVAEDVAVASFQWVRNFIPTAELVNSGVDLPDSPTPPVWFSQVLVREDDGWKIAHTHVSLAQQPGS